MITDKILFTSRYVVDNSKYVRINKDKLAEFCESINLGEHQHWFSNGSFSTDELTLNQKANFLLILHSIGFSFWGNPKWTINYKDNSYDGAYGLIAALVRAIDNGYPVLDYNYLSNINEEDLNKILEGNIQIPLFFERLNILREIGRIVSSKFDGDFTNCLNNVESDVDLLNIIIESFQSFEDKSNYKGREIPFYKRAQLLTADIYQVISDRKYGIHNLNNLTALADYKIPQILRHFGILEYSNDLTYMIDNKIEIPAHSEFENEIRANTVWAVEIMKGIIKEKIEDINSLMIDDILWLMSQDNKGVKPYHLTRTICY